MTPKLDKTGMDHWGSPYGPLVAEGEALGLEEALRQAVEALKAQSGLADFGRELESAQSISPGRIADMVTYTDRRSDSDVAGQAYVPARQALMRLHGAVVAACRAA